MQKHHKSYIKCIILCIMQTTNQMCNLTLHIFSPILYILAMLHYRETFRGGRTLCRLVRFLKMKVLLRFKILI